MNALTPIIEHTCQDVAARERTTPLDAVRRAGEARAAADPPRGFAAALRAPGISVIAEHKRSSPSAGVIRNDLALEDVVRAYERGGAAALSVLTEEHSFSGSLDDLAAARAAAALPILRKDFIVSSYQVAESLAGGADAILLIVAALAPADLERLHSEAVACGLDVLVEVHDGVELDVAGAIGAEVIGVNNRDLTTLIVDTNRTFELLDAVPSGTAVVSESGWRTRGELDRLAAAGVDAVLVGEALMRSPDVEAACRTLAQPKSTGRV
ncbi:MAG TPA: indole-3-glycerol phosphate synthase TrpC [Solirubrobacteraceae bacterium]|jgi:indole-3-glycerol phosphate synthase|nr:indole-3-glycerol phosphate synthase TrpC [Solirubrobacteraceae bacterium]